MVIIVAYLEELYCKGYATALGTRQYTPVIYRFLFLFQSRYRRIVRYTPPRTIL